MSWLPKHSIVVPIDFSASSINAIRVGLQLTESPSQLHVIHVVQPIHVAEPGMMFGTVDNTSRLAMSKKALTERLEKEGLQEVKGQVVLGNPAHSIADLAAEVKAELIVIPSHGRSGFSRLFLGSVTEKVLRLANCEVLVLRTKAEENDD